MKSNRAFRNVILFILIFTGIVACGGGGSSDSDESENSGSSASAEIVAPVGKVLIYFTSIFDRDDQFDTLDYTVHQLEVETGESLTVDFKQSFSFAKGSLFVYTFDDSLITLNNSGSSGFGGGVWKLFDLDADRDSAAIVFPQRLQVSTNEGSSHLNCVVTANDSIYWRSPETGGGLKTIGFNDAAFSESLLIPDTQPEACYTETITPRRVGGMDYADGVWYSTRYDQTTGIIEFLTRDMDTGSVTPLADITVSDHAMYDSRYSFGFDQGFVYWARVHTVTNVFEIWRYGFSGIAENLLSTTLNGITPIYLNELDVDDGFIVVRIQQANNGSHVLLFNSDDATTQLIDLHDVVPPVGGLPFPHFSNTSVMFRKP